MVLYNYKTNIITAIGVPGFAHMENHAIQNDLFHIWKIMEFGTNHRESWESGNDFEHIIVINKAQFYFDIFLNDLDIL